MPMTSVDLPAGLVEQAKRATGEKTARAAITRALQETVARAEQHRSLDDLIATDDLSALLDPKIRSQARR